MQAESKIENATAFCERAHYGQKRKYTGEPYHTHPQAVAKLVAEVTDDPDVICAALLHDVVEDTPVTFREIGMLFGSRVAHFVGEVTNVSGPEDGNRATRKQIDLEFLQRHPRRARQLSLQT